MHPVLNWNKNSSKVVGVRARPHGARAGCRARVEGVWNFLNGTVRIGWLATRIFQPSRAHTCIPASPAARACIVHADSRCTQIRSCTVCMRSPRTVGMHYGTLWCGLCRAAAARQQAARHSAVSEIQPVVRPASGLVLYRRRAGPRAPRGARGLSLSLSCS